MQDNNAVGKRIEENTKVHPVYIFKTYAKTRQAEEKLLPAWFYTYMLLELL